jgi:hypothetical protein
MTATYEKIATTTLGTDSATVTFSSITSSYTDLIVILNATTNAEINLTCQFNGDTGSNYSFTYFLGPGSGSESGNNFNQSHIVTGGFKGGTIGTQILQINNYSNATTYKTLISRTNGSDKFVAIYTGLWRNTSAISSLTMGTTSSTYATGSTFTLYGIKAE